MPDEPNEAADLSAAEAQLEDTSPVSESELEAEGSGPAQPPAEATPTGKTPEGGGEAEVAAPATDGQGQPIPAGETYRVGDRDFTLDELIKSGTLKTLVTQANQVTHFQKLAEERARVADERKARLDELEAGRAAPAERPAAPQGPTHEQKRAMVMPMVREIAEKGELSGELGARLGRFGPGYQEIAREMPDIAQDIVLSRIFENITLPAIMEAVEGRFVKLEDTFQAIHTTAAQYEEQAAADEFRGRYNGWLDDLADKDAATYGELKTNPEHRKAFTDFVADVLKTRDVKEVDAELVRGLYAAFLEKVAPGTVVALRAQAQAANAARARAAGEAGGKRVVSGGLTQQEADEKALMDGM
jgi:hypothetical protein